MKVTVYDDSEKLLAWAERVIGFPFNRASYATIGLVEDGETGEPEDCDSKGRPIVAVVVFDNFSPVDCNMHVASNGSKRWLNREFLVRVFAYPFIQCKLLRVTGLVPASNEAALKFDRHLGFVDEGRLRQGVEGDDLIVLGMLRSECRYLPDEVKNA